MFLEGLKTSLLQETDLEYRQPQLFSSYFNADDIFSLFDKSISLLEKYEQEIELVFYAAGHIPIFQLRNFQTRDD